MTWFDDGSRVRVYVSTAGDFVSIGTRTDYPFTAGAGGVPAGWTFWAEVGSSSDVYMGVLHGRWWCQNVSTTNANNGGKYNIIRDFPVDIDNYEYYFTVQASIMQGRSMAYRGAMYSPNNVGGPYGTIMAAQTEWENITNLAQGLPADTTFIRLYLQANPYWPQAADAKADWGVQFQNVSMFKVPKDSPSLLWEEITCDVKECVTRHGRAKFTSRYDVGTASLIINNDDGEFTYNPYPETGGFRPGRFIRVTGTPPGSSTEYPLYYGIIDSVTDDYGLDGRAIVNLACVDTTALLSNSNVPTMTSSGTILKSGARITYLYLSAGWDRNRALIDGGEWNQQGIVANGRSIREEMGLSADSEGGYLYGDRSGNIIYRDRGTKYNRWINVQAELLAECEPEDGLPPVDTIPTVPDVPVVMLKALGSDWSRDRIINDLMLGNQGGLAMSFTNADSQKRYGPRTYQRLDFVNQNQTTPVYLPARANDLMNGFSEAILRVNSVDFRPGKDTWKFTLEVFLNDLVRVRYTNSRNGWGYSVVSHVQQVLHSINSQGWLCQLLLDQPVAFNQWNEAETGTGWDESRWDDGKWDGVLQAFWSRDSTTWSDGISTWG